MRELKRSKQLAQILLSKAVLASDWKSLEHRSSALSLYDYALEVLENNGPNSIDLRSWYILQNEAL